MNSAQFKSIARGIVFRKGVRGDSIRYSCMVNGERFTQMCQLPTAVMINSHGGPTRELLADYAKWVASCREKAGPSAATGLHVPSIDELIVAYERIAWKRNRDPNYRKPSARTIETAVKNYGYCARASGIRGCRPYTELVDVDTIRRIFKSFIDSGIRGTSAWSYVSSLMSVTAKWTRVEYRDAGLVVGEFVMPDFGKAKEAKKYVQLSPELDAKIDAWIASLDRKVSADCVFYVTCMNNLAIRPNDLGQLTKFNFPVVDGRPRLVYKPAKTAESSNRRVDIEIPTALYEQLKDLAGEKWEAGLLLPNWRWVECKVNASMRLACGMSPEEYSKASYELRKRCLHRIMLDPEQGIDVCVKLSGDRRDTLENYYVDPYKGQKPLKLTTTVGLVSSGVSDE